MGIAKNLTNTVNPRIWLPLSNAIGLNYGEPDSANRNGVHGPCNREGPGIRFHTWRFFAALPGEIVTLPAYQPKLINYL